MLHPVLGANPKIRAPAAFTRPTEQIAITIDPRMVIALSALFVFLSI
jgi:hypothetical protein